MSVFVLSPAEFGAIAATLRITNDSLRRPIFPLSTAEQLDYRLLLALPSKQTEEEYTLSLIDPFVFRLYLANAMAERYTYMKDSDNEFRIPLFELPPGAPMNLPNLLKTLGSLSYNLVTNGGNSFLGIRDDEKLRDLIERVKTAIISTKQRA